MRKFLYLAALTVVATLASASVAQAQYLTEPIEECSGAAEQDFYKPLYFVPDTGGCIVEGGAGSYGPLANTLNKIVYDPDTGESLGVVKNLDPDLSSGANGVTHQEFCEDFEGTTTPVTAQEYFDGDSEAYGELEDGANAQEQEILDPNGDGQACTSEDEDDGSGQDQYEDETDNGGQDQYEDETEGGGTTNGGSGGDGTDDDTTASDIADAIASDSANVTGASFDALPPEGTPNAVSNNALTGFPTDGETYGILTTGDAAIAATPNNAEDSGTANGGDEVRGDTDADVTVLKVDFDVPEGANCLSLDFRFFSEEFPEYVGDQFNDTFIAELDDSTWTTSGSDISAPDNFAFDPDGDVVSINSTGVANMSEADAEGTTYDGATQLLQARSQITPGAHSLYLSILDQGDQIYDSAAFVDNVSAFNATDADCQEGVQEGPKDPTPPKDNGDDKIPVLPNTGGPALSLAVAGLLVGSGLLGLFVATRRRT